MAEREIADIYVKLRDQAIGFGSVEIKAPPVVPGGRVLGVTASGADLEAAIDNAYAAARLVHFEGMHYRTDIGRKGLKRYPAAP